MSPDSPGDMSPDSPPVGDSADVLVVGGGLSGLIVAEQLAARGFSTLVLEAGPVITRDLTSCTLSGFRAQVQPLLEIDEQAWAYRAEGASYDWIRVRAGGGRSLLWGGWALRPDPQSFRDARAFGRPWPVRHEDLASHLWRAERLLAVSEGTLDPVYRRVTDRLGLEVQPKRGALSPCGCCPFVALDWQRRARLRSQAVALRLVFDGARRVTGVEYLDLPTGRSATARARVTVLAASPVETTRLLLTSAPGGPGGAEGLVGRGFMDHQVRSYLVLQAEPAPAVAPQSPLERAAFVPRFVNLGRRRRRDYRGGFSLELHGPDPVTNLDAATQAALGIDGATASGLSYHLVHAIGEIPPRAESTITLHPEQRDSLGRPIPVIRLASGAGDVAMARDMEETALAVCDALATEGSRVFDLRSLTGRAVGAHEAGTCPMGTDARRAPVDIEGRVRGVPGLYVADASLLPSGLDRPPTLTVLALALNTADSIVAEGRSAASSSGR